jgi:chromosomal replication initiator protein
MVNKVNLIINLVSRESGVPVSDMLGRSRKAHIVRARHLSMWLSRWTTTTSLQQIALLHGCTNHANVIHACNQIDNLCDTNKSYSQFVSNLKSITKQF